MSESSTQEGTSTKGLDTVIGKRLIWIALLAILVGGFLLRLIPAANYPIWLDEAVYFFHGRNNSLGELILMRHGDASHPPLFMLFSNLWQRVDTHPFFLRLPNLVFSTLAIWLFYKIGAQVKDRIFGFFLAVFLAISTFQVKLDWQFRMYTLETVFIAFSILLLLKILATGEKKFLAAFAIVNFLVFFNDYSGIWYLLCLGLLNLVLWFRGKAQYAKRLVGGLLASVILPSLWLPIFFTSLGEGLAREEYLGTIDFWRVLSTLVDFIDTGDLLPVAVFIFGLSLVVMSINGWEDRLWMTFRILLILFLLVPLILSFIASQFSPILIPHNLLVVSIGIIFGLGYLFWLLVSRGLTVLALYGLIVYFAIYPFYYQKKVSLFRGGDYRQVRDHILTNSPPEEKITIVFVGRGYETIPLRFYLDGFDHSFKSRYEILAFKNKEEFQRIRGVFNQVAQNFWLVSYWEKDWHLEPGYLTQNESEALLGCQKDIFNLSKKYFDGISVHKCLRQI